MRADRWIVLGFLAGLAVETAIGEAKPVPEPVCRTMDFEGHDLTICTADLNLGEVRLAHSDGDGALIGYPSAVPTGEDEELIFAMNAGMFHMDRSPVGHFVEDGVEHVRLIRGDGPGNFQLLPNGVFYVADGEVGILETEAFADAELKVDYATQSGPMLVIDGELHPAFRASSDSLFIRNGVGVTDDGQTAVFAISDAPLNFHTFARVFRDGLELDNALFLDGNISLLYAPELSRTDIGLPVGPLVAYVKPIAD